MSLRKGNWDVLLEVLIGVGEIGSSYLLHDAQVDDDCIGPVFCTRSRATEQIAVAGMLSRVMRNHR
jgi:hypothetical protein